MKRQMIEKTDAEKAKEMKGDLMSAEGLAKTVRALNDKRMAQLDELVSSSSTLKITCFPTGIFLPTFAITHVDAWVF